MRMNHITVTADGAVVTTTGTSQSVAIPLTSAGTKPRYIRVASTAAAHFQLFKDATGQATTADTLVQPGDSEVVAVAGLSNIAVIQSSAPGLVQIQPLEDA